MCATALLSVGATVWLNKPPPPPPPPPYWGQDALSMLVAMLIVLLVALIFHQRVRIPGEDEPVLKSSAKSRRQSKEKIVGAPAPGPEFWDWGTGRFSDDTMSRIHNERRVHGDCGAFMGGNWIDIEDCAKLYVPKDPSHSKVGCGACPRSRSRHSAAKSDGTYDIIIIGAGCIGSAIARELSKTTESVLILEAADDVTQGATKGNSGIVHAGFDDKPGTNRAKYCWPGNQMFPQLDRELRFGFQKTGSLVVARNDTDMALLDELLERGHKNGVQNLRIVKQEELLQIEPDLDRSCVGALLAPDAGTITPYEYTIALAENACDNGVEVRTRREVTAITGNRDSIFTLTVKHWEPEEYTRGAPGWGKATGGDEDTPGAATPKHSYSPSPGTVFHGTATSETYRAKFVINAAGCASDKVAAMVGDTSWHVKPRMGEYILLHKNQGHKARHILFPCPHPVFGKGCLVQATLWGNLILGPTARDTMIKDPATGQYEPDPNVLGEDQDNIMGYILAKSRALVPNFDPGQVIHTFAGVRAKNTTGDWIIGPVAGVPGFINAASIDSPGIAASPAIAVDVVRMLREAGAPLTPDPSFKPNRAPSIVPKDGYRGLKMSRTEFWKVKDPKENVICKCERVTEQEIIDMCARSLPVDSTQAMRKRTRAGMGYCQGDPENYDCETRVAAIIARETGLSMEQVGRRPWPGSSMMSKRLLDDDDKDHLRVLSDPVNDYTLHGAAA